MKLKLSNSCSYYVINHNYSDNTFKACDLTIVDMNLPFCINTLLVLQLHSI